MFLRFFLTLLMSITLVGCTCKQAMLTNSEKEWVSFFHINDVAVYVDSNDTKDTVQIVEIRNFHGACNRFELGEYQEEIFDVDFIFKTQNRYNGVHSLIVMRKKNIAHVNPIIHVANIGPINDVDAENDQIYPMDTMINGKFFHSVYYFSIGQNAKSRGENIYLKNFIWDKKSGLIAYMTTDNNFYVKNER